MKKNLIVNQLKKLGNFYLFEIPTDSYHKKILIELVSNELTKLKTEDISFSTKNILLNLKLSYDFVKNQALTINTL